MADEDELDRCNRIISSHESTLSSLPDDHSGDRTAMIYELADTYYDKFILAEEISDLDQAILHFEHALSLLSPAQPEHERAEWFLNSASALQRRFEVNDDISDLQRAMDLYEKNISVNALTKRKIRSRSLISFGNAAESMFYETVDVSFLDKAIDAKEEALSLCLVKDRLPNGPRSKLLADIADARHKRIKISGESHGVDRLVQLHTDRLDLLQPSDPLYGLGLVNLAYALTLRFDTLHSAGELSPSGQNDLDRAILTLEKLVSCPEPTSSLSATAYSMTALRYHRRYSAHGGAPTDLDRAIELNEMAVELNPTYVEYWHRVATNLCMRYKASKQSLDLEKTIAFLRQSLALPISPEESYRYSYSWLILLANILRDILGDLASFDPRNLPATRETLELLYRGLTLIPNPDPLERVSCLKAMADTLISQFQVWKELDDIDRAVVTITEALALSKGSEKHIQACLLVHGRALECRYVQTRELEDLDCAIQLFRSTIALQGNQTHTDLALCVMLLVSLLRMRFTRSTDIDDLDTATALLELHVKTCPQGDAEPEVVVRAAYLYETASVYARRYDIQGQHSELERAIALHENALALRLNADPESRMMSLRALSEALCFNFSEQSAAGVTESTQFLDRAISLCEEGLSYPSSDKLKPHRHGLLLCYADALRYRYQALGRVDDINSSIECCNEASQMYPEDSPERSLSLHYLAEALVMLYQQSGDLSLSGLDKAITLYREALKDGSLRVSNRDDISLCSLGSAYCLRFFNTGQILDLDQATQLLEMAVERLSVAHARRKYTVAQLTMTVLTRFNNTMAKGSLYYLSKVIKLQTEELDFHRSMQKDKHSRLRIPPNLPVSLMTRFEETHDLSDLNCAIEYLREDLSVYQEHFVRYCVLNNLALALRTRYDHDATEIDSDLDEAICLQMQSLECLEQGHSDRPLALANLAESFYRKYLRHAGTVSDLEKAISYMDQASQSASESNLQYSIFRTELAGYHLEGPQPNPEFAFSVASQVAASPSASIIVRFRAALMCIEISTYIEPSWNSGFEAYKTAINLLSALFLFEVDPETRLRNLRQAARIASDAPAWALSGGKTRRALEWVDHGRGIFWTHILHLDLEDSIVTTTNISDAPVGVTESLNKLRDLSGKLKDASIVSLSQLQRESSLLLPKGVTMTSSEIYRRRKLQQEWTETVEGIREAGERFRDFLGPTPGEKLSNVAQGGPVVILIGSQHGCYAIIITPDKVEECLLLDVSLETLEGLKVKLTGLTRDMRETEEGHLRLKWVRQAAALSLENILETLWTLIGKPVVSFLGLQKKEIPTRVWWCPTGLFTFLPIHAAGIYNLSKEGGDVSEGMMDFAISSYIPAPSALILARTRAHSKPSLLASPSESRSILLVAQPYAKGCMPLPLTLEERKRVANILPENSLLYLDSDRKFEVFDGTDATIQNTLAKLPSASIVHFACHGVQHEDALESGLLLYDGKLCLSDLIHAELPHAEIAFLSSCESATGDQMQPDEAVHLGAGMLAAGFQSVVATMWSMQDSAGPIVAEGFYSCLFGEENGGDHSKAERAAYALHQAIMKFRAVNAPLASWVPFIHLGI